MKLRPRDIQTQVKHRILEEYLGAWSGIILNGLRQPARRSSQPLDVHFIYVDCFAYTGKYAGDKQDTFLERASGPVTGSPIIGIRSLDDALARAHPNINLSVNSILIEEDKAIYEALLENLKADGFGPRLRETTDFSSLADGEIAVVQDDATQLRDELLNYTDQQHTWAFYFLDPYGPRGIPMDFVSPIVNADNHDVMINFMYMDLHRKSGASEEDGQLQLKQPEHAQRWTDVFGSEKWLDVVRDIATIRSERDLWLRVLGLTQEEAKFDPLLEKVTGHQSWDDEYLSELAERRLVNLYQETLRQVAPGVAVKKISLNFPNQDRTFFYLFLTTHDGTGALKMNDVLVKAKVAERELQHIRRKSKKLIPPARQLYLFPPKAPDPPQVKPSPRPDKEEIDETIVNALSGRTMTLRKVFVELADTIYFEGEVKSSLNRMRKEGRVDFRGRLSNKTVIVFK